MRRPRFPLTWPQRLVLGAAAIVVLFLHVAFPILQYPGDRLLVFDDHYRGISTWALFATLLWIAVYLHFRFKAWRAGFAADYS